MRFPWQKRADEEHKKRLQAEARLKETTNSWGEIHHVRAELHAAHGPDGWTGIAAKLFSNHTEGKS
jgi:hypothetical protein